MHQWHTACGVAAALALAAGCGEVKGYTIPGDDGGSAGAGGESGNQAPGQFTEIEREVILADLGVLDELPDDPTNRYANGAKTAALGQRFFFEQRFSKNGEIGCVTCHNPERSFADGRSLSLGLGLAQRNTPTVVNAAFASGEPGATPWQLWDGRRDSQWAQALGPPEDPREMGASRSKVALLIYDEYRAAYEEVFGQMPALRDDEGNPAVSADALPGSEEWDALDAAVRDDITRVYVNFGKAIAAYERLLVSRRSRFDAFYEELAAGAEDSDALTQPEKDGLKVFVGKGRCSSCHRGPNFSDWKFHNIGVAQTGKDVPEEDSGRELGIQSVTDDEFNCAGRWSDSQEKDDCAVSQLMVREADRGAFKTPGLRNVAETGPYFHTGELETLADVIDFYDAGGAASGFVGTTDENIRQLGLTSAERADLEAFLRALTGEPIAKELLEAP